MPDTRQQRQHYDELVRTERPTRYGLSCGYRDRYDPGLLDRRPTLRRVLGRLFDRLLPGSPETVLDLGCGTAYYWPVLAERCDRLLGVDISPAMLARGRRHLIDSRQIPGLLFCSVADRIPLAAASVDVVLAVDALHHVADLDAVLAEVRRILRPGGRFVAVEPNVINPVVLTAHLLPPEERGAVWPNNPWAVKAALEHRFDDVTLEPITYVSGLQNARILRAVELVEPLFRHRPLSYVALRRIYRAS